MVPIVFFVILITFFLMHPPPRNPGDNNRGPPLSAAVRHKLDLEYGLNKPEYQQFELYLWNAAHFDFGLSYPYEGKTVTALIGEGTPYTATPGVLAFLIIGRVGIALGVAAALRQNTRTAYITMGFATV